MIVPMCSTREIGGNYESKESQPKVEEGASVIKITGPDSKSIEILRMTVLGYDSKRGNH